MKPRRRGKSKKRAGVRKHKNACATTRLVLFADGEELGALCDIRVEPDDKPDTPRAGREATGRRAEDERAGAQRGAELREEGGRRREEEESRRPPVTTATGCDDYGAMTTMSYCARARGDARVLEEVVRGEVARPRHVLVVEEFAVAREQRLWEPGGGGCRAVGYT